MQTILRSTHCDSFPMAMSGIAPRPLVPFASVPQCPFLERHGIAGKVADGRAATLTAHHDDT
jgi:hypothetical protein